MDQQTPTEQAPAASVEDRIASIFGGAPQPEQAQEEPIQPEPAEAASEEQPQGEVPAPVEETFELEVDGEKFTLPKKLEKGFLQERDYTQKSQTLAEQRRNTEFALEQARIARLNEAFSTEVSQEQDQIRALDWAIQQPVDWSTLSTDDAFRRKMQIDQWEKDKSKLEKTIGEKRNQFNQKVQAEFAKLRQQSLETISKRIPGFNEATAKAIRDHALGEGYTEAELNSILDPRHVQTMWKAQQYDALKAKATPAAQTAKSVKTTPTNPMPQHVKDKLAFRKEVGKHAPGSHAQQQLVKDRIAKIFG